jgi:signal transduction histidine kinase
MSAMGEGPEPRGPAEGTSTVPTVTTREGALFEAIFDASPAGLAIVSGEGLRFDRVNAAYRALVPDPTLDPVGRTFPEVWPDADGALATALQRTLATGEPAGAMIRVVHANGRERRFAFHLRRVASQGRTAVLVTGWETTVQDAARDAAEDTASRALRHAAELDAVLDAIADGFVLFDARGEALRLNATAARLVARAGLAPRTAFSELWAHIELLTPDGRPVRCAETPVVRALRGATVHGAHLHVKMPATGSEAWIIASAAPIRGPAGAVLGAVLTFSDESEMHALEEARDDLVRMIGHDLRTPLNAVYQQAHLLRRSPEDALKVAERAAVIVRSCQRMSAMIQDLVETVLLEAGQLTLVRTAVDLGALVPELLERLRGGLEVDRVRVAIAPALPLADADPDRLERVLVNLLSNALKYSPAESAVRLELAPAPDGGVLVIVADRGVGIAPEDQARIFDRFFRARGSRRPEGLGLGLYITRLLVEAHGGRIDVTSGLGQGSTFRVRLPARRALP